METLCYIRPAVSSDRIFTSQVLERIILQIQALQSTATGRVQAETKHETGIR
jgi:hypothetical protein